MYIIIVMALIGGAIGWTTNIIAIKLLFRPLKPTKILGLFTIQGLIPKRREEIAKSVAKTIETELLDLEHVLDKVIESMDKKAVLASLELKIGEVIINNLPGLMRSFSSSILNYLHEMLEKEGDQLLTEMTEVLVHKAVDKISISDIVEEKILAYDVEKLESIIIDLAKKELVQIERLGGVLGLIIGLIQGAIVYYFV